MVAVAVVVVALGGGAEAQVGAAQVGAAQVGVARWGPVARWGQAQGHPVLVTWVPSGEAVADLRWVHEVQDLLGEVQDLLGEILQVPRVLRAVADHLKSMGSCHYTSRGQFSGMHAVSIILKTLLIKRCPEIQISDKVWFMLFCEISMSNTSTFSTYIHGLKNKSFTIRARLNYKKKTKKFGKTKCSLKTRGLSCFRILRLEPSVVYTFCGFLLGMKQYKDPAHHPPLRSACLPGGKGMMPGRPTSSRTTGSTPWSYGHRSPRMQNPFSERSIDLSQPHKQGHELGLATSDITLTICFYTFCISV